MLAAVATTSTTTAGLAVAFLTDLVAIFVFAVLIYFRRHTRRGLTIVFSFFNIGIFVVVTVIGRAEFQAAIGFGLFAMLSIIRLRSDPFSHREIGYFFGAMVLGVLNAIGMPEYGFTLALNLVLVGAMFVLDHPALLCAAPRMNVTLDRVITEPNALHDALETRLGAQVREVTIRSVDYVRDMMELRVQYLAPPLARPLARTTNRTATTVTRTATRAERPPRRSRIARAGLNQLAGRRR